MDKKNRVFLIAGPIQALMALSVIEDTVDKASYNDYAFLTKMCADKNAADDIIAATMSFLKTGPFKRIDDIGEISETIIKLFDNGNFEESESLMREIVGLDKVDELIMMNNAQHQIQRIAGRSFDFSYIVNYGDGMGFITSGIGFEVSHLDEIRTFLPIDHHKGFCDRIPLKIMDKGIFYTVVDKYYDNDAGFRSSIEKRRASLPENAVLLMLQQLTEKRMMDFEDEISMYVKAVRRNCQKGETIVIKDHPRSTAKKRGQFLADQLNEAGYSVIWFEEEELRLIPIEVICRFLKFKRVICTTSTSGITLRYLYGMEADISVDEEDYDNYKRSRFYLRTYVDGLKQALKNVDTWKMDGPLYSYDTPPFSYQTPLKNTKDITYEDAYYKIIASYYMKKRRLSAFFTEKGIKSVAIYGMSKIGRIIAEDLIDGGELEVYLLDRSLCGKTYMDKQIYYFDTLDNNPGCVFVATTYSFNEIKGLVRKHLSCEQVFCLADL